jgi:hypothetical protein
MKTKMCECGENTVGDGRWPAGHSISRCEGWEDRLVAQVKELTAEIDELDELVASGFNMLRVAIHRLHIRLDALEGRSK